VLVNTCKTVAKEILKEIQIPMKELLTSLLNLLEILHSDYSGITLPNHQITVVGIFYTITQYFSPLQHLDKAMAMKWLRIIQVIANSPNAENMKNFDWFTWYNWAMDNLINVFGLEG
jgi:hypothetical protein